MYLLLLALIYLAFISLGLPDSLLGAAWPTIHVSYNVPISYMGIISVIISAGTILSSLLSERLTAKLGTRVVTTASVLLTAMALFGFSTAKSFIILCLIAIPYGLGAGAIDASLNNYVALHYTSKHMSWLHCFWGVGSIISPYVMSYALLHSVWQNGYRAVSFIQIGIFLILLLTLPVWKINSTNKPYETTMDVKPLGVRGAMRIKGVPYLLMGFLAYCAAESTTMLWASSYLEERINLTKDEAAALGSLFFIGMTVGRFFAGFITERLGDGKMIRLGTVIALVGVGLISIPIKIPSIIGFILIGLGCAPIYPSIIHSTPTNFGEQNSSAIIGIQMAAAYTGSLLAPPLFGILAENISLGIMPIYLLTFLSIMILMIKKTESAVK
jgi:fucose permease